MPGAPEHGEQQSDRAGLHPSHNAFERNDDYVVLAWFQRLVDVLVRCGFACAATLVLSLAALLAYEVVARYAFGNPTGFANQIAAYMMPAITFLAAAGTLARGGHVAIDLFVSMLPESMRSRWVIFLEGVSVLLLVAVTFVSIFVVLESHQGGYRAFSTTFTFPEYIPQIIMPLGFGLLTLQQFREFVAAVLGIRRPGCEADHNREELNGD